jgi:hypothetical protein
MPAIERRQRQQVDHRQCHREQRQEGQKVHYPQLRLLAGQLGDADGTSHRLPQRELPTHDMHDRVDKSGSSSQALRTPNPNASATLYVIRRCGPA